MRKTIWTLDIDNYAPHLKALTYPLFKRYAHKIGAEFAVIDQRKFPEWPVVYEKLQIFELGKDNDWNIYIDSDAIVHPDMFDVTDHLPRDTVLHNGRDMAGNRWKYDRFFRRDGRHIGSCNWFTVASDLCIDLWKPLDDLSAEEAINNIFPVRSEVMGGILTASHLIDDYVLSRNIAKFGLKFDTLIDLKKRLGDGMEYLFHLYNIPETQKIQQIGQFLLKNGLMQLSPNY